MATIKKPKMRKYGKKPKATASATVKKNYLQRCKDIDKDNAEKIREYDKKVSAKLSEKKESERLTKQISGIGRAKSPKSKHKR